MATDGHRYGKCSIILICNTNDLNLRGPQRFFDTGTQLHSHWGIRVLVSRWLPRLESRRNHYEPQRHRDHREDNEAGPVKVGAAVADSGIEARFLCELCASVVQNLWFRPQAGLGSSVIQTIQICAPREDLFDTDSQRI
jgi:hypothetical protein